MSALPPVQIDVGIDASDTPEGIRALSESGADEFFAGYVPAEWSDRYGWEIGLNRRTFGPNCQFTSLVDLQAAIVAAHAVHRPVFITFNAHDYHAEQVPLLRQIVLDICTLGPDALIVADPALLELLSQWGVTTPVHLSIGAGCFNGEAVRHFCRIANIRRVVLPRKMSLAEMETMIAGLADLKLDFEALVIGYRCLFNDEFCFTRHTGIAEPFCNSFVPDPEAPASYRLPSDWKDVADKAAQAPDEQFQPGSTLDRFRKARRRQVRPPVSVTAETAPVADGLDGLVASSLFTHCALCAIPGLRRAGVNVLKVPVRGTGVLKARHLQVVRQVVDHPAPTPEFCRSLIGSPGYCAKPGNCYYATENNR
jgi:putative protease